MKPQKLCLYVHIYSCSMHVLNIHSMLTMHPYLSTDAAASSSPTPRLLCRRGSTCPQPLSLETSIRSKAPSAMILSTSVISVSPTSLWACTPYSCWPMKEH